MTEPDLHPIDLDPVDLDSAVSDAVYDCSDPGQRADGLKAAERAISSGELVVLPTDTVYGLAADAFSPNAVAAAARAFETSWGNRRGRSSRRAKLSPASVHRSPSRTAKSASAVPNVRRRAGAFSRWRSTTGSSALPTASASGFWSRQIRALAST